MSYEKFGKYIKEKRESLQPKVAQNAFALENEFEPAILCRIENCKQDTKLNVLAKIAKGFNLKASQLLEEFENSEYFD